MNRLLWLILNLALVLLVCGVGLLLSDDDPATHWDKTKAEAMAAAEPSEASVAPEHEAPSAVAWSNRHEMDSKTLESLWRRSLFRPERTEDPETKAEAEKAAAEEPVRKVEFELVAIAMINDRRVALLDVKQAAAPRPPPNLVRAPPRGAGARVVTPKELPAKPAKTRHVYKEGDAVEETGYVVAEIHKADVLLKRGDEELVVTLETTDETSLARRDAAAAEAKAAAATPEEKPETKPAGAASIPATPPPPPPTPGGAVAAPTASGGDQAVKAEALDERLQRMRDERYRLLRERQKLSTPENPN